MFERRKIVSTLFYDLMSATLAADRPRCLVVQILLKHWPDESIKVCFILTLIKSPANKPRGQLSPTYNIVPSVYDITTGLNSLFT